MRISVGSWRLEHGRSGRRHPFLDPRALPRPQAVSTARRPGTDADFVDFVVDHHALSHHFSAGRDDVRARDPQPRLVEFYHVGQLHAMEQVLPDADGAVLRLANLEIPLQFDGIGVMTRDHVNRKVAATTTGADRGREFEALTIGDARALPRQHGALGRVRVGQANDFDLDADRP